MGNRYHQQVPQPDFTAEYQSHHKQLLQGKIRIFMSVVVELSLKQRLLGTEVHIYLSGLPHGVAGL